MKKVLVVGLAICVAGLLASCTNMLAGLRGDKGEIGRALTEKVKVLDKNEYTGTAGAATDKIVYVLFGDWPQTLKNDDVTVDEKTTKIQGMFTYCLGSDNEWYVKCKENGSKKDYTYSDNKTPVGQGGESEKWFKVEPIKWRVLTKEFDHDGDSTTDKQWLLLAENILTGGVPYYVDSEDRAIKSSAILPNNYQYSTIRAYLNGTYENGDTQQKKYENSGFLQSAFTENAQSDIKKTKVDNSAQSTSGGSGDSPAENCICNTTEDKIFLLSVKEAATKDYGFESYDSYGNKNCRIRVTTDYAKATGASNTYVSGNAVWWWLRSPSTGLNFVRNVEYDGYARTAAYKVTDTNGGIVPALSILP